MGKKILVVLGIFAFVAIVTLGVTTCGVMKIADDWIKEKEPELRQYVQMTEDEQNAYVEKNRDELLRRIKVYAEKNPENTSPEQKETWKKIVEDPEVKAAGLQLGRSIVALLISSSDNITKDLSAEDKAKYEKEANELQERTDIYTKLLEKYIPEKK
ncbi:MAG: hypothetical protein IKZ58_04215 [Selenomonadaceae bacterium]|nr:hypothetical protein [Selenomonadaceae bacterium]